MPSLPVAFNATLDPLDYVREAMSGRALVPSYRDPKGGGSLDTLERRLKRIRYVTEAELGHLNYISVDPETGNAATAARRVADVDRKARAIISAWAMRLPTE